MFIVHFEQSSRMQLRNRLKRAALCHEIITFCGFALRGFQGSIVSDETQIAKQPDAF